ncbi:MAG TPA: hypothetical protein VD973_23775, partial [Symbiobacteriaceae bacterium]|nr:hypothetical protein [Symbiobacteriaceae bacterium]
MPVNLPPALTDSEQVLRRALGASEDIIFQRYSLKADGRPALLAFVEGMIDRVSLENQVVEVMASTDPS